MRNKENTGVQYLRAVGLGESLNARVESALAHLLVNALSQGPEMRQDVLPAEAWGKLFDELDETIDRHPGHDLRVSEVPATTTNLPDAVVRALPNLVDVFEHRLGHRQGLFSARHPLLPCNVDGIGDFPENI